MRRTPERLRHIAFGDGSLKPRENLLVQGRCIAKQRCFRNATGIECDEHDTGLVVIPSTQIPADHHSSQLSALKGLAGFEGQ